MNRRKLLKILGLSVVASHVAIEGLANAFNSVPTGSSINIEKCPYVVDPPLSPCPPWHNEEADPIKDLEFAMNEMSQAGLRGNKAGLELSANMKSYCQHEDESDNDFRKRILNL